MDGAYLFTNGFICILCGFCYLILSKNKFPRPPKVAPMSEETKQALKDYEDTGSIRWLPHKELIRINKELVLAGKPRLIVPFGSFEEDVNDLDRIVGLAKEDFPHSSEYFKENIRKWTKGTDAERAELRKMMEGLEELLEWPDEDKAAFGDWIAKYLMHAGYVRPGLQPRFWKAAIQAAFPKMMQGGTKEESLAIFRMNPVPLWVRVDALMNSYMRTMKETDQTIQALSKLKVTNVQIAGCA